jgi:asparagine synthase (glutamine-hydrolysing)
MSVHFGRWNFEGQPPAPDYIEKVAAALAPYGSDSNESYSKGGVGILNRAFHTTRESRREKQPCISPSGAVISWDGRLDNRAELISELRDSLTVNSTDVAVVAAAYEKRGANCLGKLIGDWALSIWNPRDRSVLLAKDPIGTKHLYYSFDDKQLTWSTILDPLITFAGRTFALSEEYIAGWLSMFPAPHLTPYVGIHSVPPSSFVLLRPGKHVVSTYWDFDPEKHIRHSTDAEYEDHFRTVFATAVHRRLRSDRPVLAELSGGMDSSSIVCMADTVIARGHADCPRLDTISWYRSSNPGLDERPYFTKVEEKRGHVGCHIDLDSLAGLDPRGRFQSEFENDHFAATPNSNRHLSEFFKQYAAFMKSQGNRVVLSGLGGDEATGSGIPNPTPELQNLLARARFITFARQLNAWATKMRQFRFSLLREAARGFFVALSPLDMFTDLRPVPWFHPSFVRRNRAALGSYPSRLRLFGPLPGFQDNMRALDAERRLQAHISFSSDLLNREVRCPYLDRDFLEFMYAIPREQVVRVGQRRSLMRRALVGIVPDELLKIRNKTAVPQDPPKDKTAEWTTGVEIGQHMVSNSMGIVDPSRFCEAMRKARRNEGVPIERLMRTLMIEFWLRHLAIKGVLGKSVFAQRRNCSSISETEGVHAPVQPNSSAS